jgi:hypothetical protein
MNARRLLIRAIVAALCVTAAIAIAVLLGGDVGPTAWRVLGTTSAISFFGLLAVPTGMLLERGRALVLARVSGALTLASFVLTLAVIWIPWTNGLGKTWGVVLTLAVAAAQACAVEARRRDNDTPTVSALASGSMVTGAGLAAMGVAAILSGVDTGGYYRLLAAVAVLDVLLIVLAAVLRRSAGPIGQTHRMRLDGRLVEVPARDFGGAVAVAIRQAEKDGTQVRRIERA